jgi:hypothetical protein
MLWCSPLLALLLGKLFLNVIKQLSFRLNRIHLLSVQLLVSGYREEDGVSEAERRISDKALKIFISEHHP